jgi:hypothetical protein
MRKIVVAKALVLAIFSFYLAVAMVELPSVKSERARSDKYVSRVIDPTAANGDRCLERDRS